MNEWMDHLCPPGGKFLVVTADNTGRLVQICSWQNTGKETNPLTTSTSTLIEVSVRLEWWAKTNLVVLKAHILRRQIPLLFWDHRYPPVSEGDKPDLWAAIIKYDNVLRRWAKNIHSKVVILKVRISVFMHLSTLYPFSNISGRNKSFQICKTQFLKIHSINTR